MANAVTGAYQSTANPLYVCLQSEAQRAIQLLQAEGVIPQGVDVRLNDEPWNFPNLRYGTDGRRVWVIEWTEPNPEDSSAPFNFVILGGEVDFQLKCFPEGRGDWLKEPLEGEVDRIGLRGGNNSNTRPAQVFLGGSIVAKRITPTNIE